MAVPRLSFDELIFCATRTGVTNWTGGKVVPAPSSHRGKRGSMGTVVGVTRHHTGTPETFRAAEDYPTYQVVKEGRAGLENSLSAYGLGRHSGIYVFSEFLSWHAGAWNYAGITDGNGHFLGIEAEGTGAFWTAFQREFYPRLCGSVLSYIGAGADMMPRHMDGCVPRGRKSDARNLWSSFTAQVQGYIDNPKTITYGTAPAPSPTPLEDEDDMLLLRNKDTAAIVVVMNGRTAPLRTTADHLAFKKAGVQQIDVGGPLFEALTAAPTPDA
jgi:hypothetical protein